MRALLCPCWLCAAPLRLRWRSTRWSTRAKGRVWRSVRRSWRNCAGRARAASTPPNTETRRCRSVCVCVCVFDVMNGANYSFWSFCGSEIFLWLTEEELGCLSSASQRGSSRPVGGWWYKKKPDMVTTAGAKRIWSYWLQPSVRFRRPVSQPLEKTSHSHNLLHLYFSKARIRITSADFKWTHADSSVCHTQMLLPPPDGIWASVRPVIRGCCRCWWDRTCCAEWVWTPNWEQAVWVPVWGSLHRERNGDGEGYDFNPLCQTF